jgi:hypothetical protein
MKWTIRNVAVTVAVAAVTGNSGAQAAIANNNSRIIGFVPTGVATSTGFGLIETITLAQSTGTITITTRAAVATADLTVDVIVATPVNS